VLIESASKQYVEVEVWADEDPSYKVVELAFVDANADNPTVTYISGNWKSAKESGNRWKAVCRALVGPGTSADLDPGLYEVLVKISSVPETPVVSGGYVTVTDGPS
jgi:hypothetical protein